MKRSKKIMDELSAGARLHIRARAASNTVGQRLHAFAAYGALGLIAAIILGIVSVRPL